MIRRVFSALGPIVHTCSEFGHYFMSFQDKCFKPGRRTDCEGNPTLEDARKDFRAMLRVRHSTLIG